MLQLNYNTRLIDIRNTLGQLRRRMITLIGRQFLNTDSAENESFNAYPPQPGWRLWKTLKQKYTSIFGMVKSMSWKIYYNAGIYILGFENAWLYWVYYSFQLKLDKTLNTI